MPYPLLDIECIVDIVPLKYRTVVKTRSTVLLIWKNLVHAVSAHWKPIINSLSPRNDPMTIGYFRAFRNTRAINHTFHFKCLVSYQFKIYRSAIRLFRLESKKISLWLNVHNDNWVKKIWAYFFLNLLNSWRKFHVILMRDHLKKF